MAAAALDPHKHDCATWEDIAKREQLEVRSTDLSLRRKLPHQDWHQPKVVLLMLVTMVLTALASLHGVKYHRIKMTQSQAIIDANSHGVSVCISVFTAHNAVPNLPAVLRSLEHQTISPLELILVVTGIGKSNCSIYRKKISKRLNKMKIRTLCRQLGSSMHSACSIARGHIVTFLNASTTLAANQVEVLQQTFDRWHPNVVLTSYTSTPMQYEPLAVPHYEYQVLNLSSSYDPSRSQDHDDSMLHKGQVSISRSVLQSDAKWMYARARGNDNYFGDLRQRYGQRNTSVLWIKFLRPNSVASRTHPNMTASTTHVVSPVAKSRTIPRSTHKAHTALDVSPTGQIRRSRVKIRHYVLSLDGVPGSNEHNRGRLKAFREHWNRKCNSTIQFELCPGVQHPIGGVGVALGFSRCLKRAIRDDAQIGYFFEDDAILFSDSFCDASFQENLFNARPKDALMVLLGGHDFKQIYKAMRHKRDLLRILSTYQDHVFVPIQYSCGLYGFGVARDYMPVLLDHFNEEVENGERTKQLVAPDVSIHALAKDQGKFMYVINPMLVDHQRGAWSNTKSGTRNDDWIGHADFLFGSDGYLN